jgi:hypothetical protein
MATPAAGDPIAWKAIVYGTPVYATDGTAAGVVREVLGSDAEDIFHGLRVRLTGRKDDVMVPADHATGLTTTRIDTDLAPAALAALPAYEEHSTYHLASVGWLRRHLGWKSDSKSDEEPG